MNMLKRTKQVVCLLLCTAIMLSMLPKQVFAEETAAQGTVEYGVKNPTYTNHVATFDCVWFGNYMQSSSEKEPIKWRVLSVDGNKALLMADKNLENKRFNDEWNWSVPWENCTLREWMNSDFKETAFAENEQAALINHSETGDSVFALSKPEMDAFNARLTENGFDSLAIDAVWKSSNTNYLNDCLQQAEIAEPNSGWWLRSNGLFNFMAYFINWGGGQDYRNVDEKDENGRTMARPCVYLDLSKIDCWSYAGTVSSDGTVNKSFDYIKDTWNFSNPTSKISASIYGMFFDWEKVKELHTDKSGTGGHCAGMSISTATIYEGFPKVSSFGQYSCLNEIGKNIYSNEAKCTAIEYIDYAYVYQTTQKFLKQANKNTNNCNGLYQAMKSFQYSNGAPVLIAIASEEGIVDGAHLLMGVAVEQETEQYAKILVYDCNHPNDKCYLVLKKSNGLFDGWSYDLLGWDDTQKEAKISYLTIISDFINDYNIGYAEKNNDILLMKTQKGADGLLKYGEINELLTNLNNTKSEEITPIVIANGTDTSEYDKYWLDNSRKVEIDDFSKDSEVRLANDDMTIALQNSKEADVSIDMNNKEVAINSESNSYDVEYEESLDYENSKLFSVKGTEKDNVNIKNTKDNIWEMSGTTGFSVSYETKIYEDDGTSNVKKEQEAELKKANADSVYQIEATDTSIIIREDKDKDGVFEKQIVPADENGSGSAGSGNAGKQDNPKPEITPSNVKTNSNAPENVQTGDTNNIACWLLLIGASLIVISSVVLYKRRKIR